MLRYLLDLLHRVALLHHDEIAVELYDLIPVPLGSINPRNGRGWRVKPVLMVCGSASFSFSHGCTGEFFCLVQNGWTIANVSIYISA